MTRFILKTSLIAAGLSLFTSLSSAQGLIQLEVPLRPITGALGQQAPLVANTAIGINCPAPAVRTLTAHRIGGGLIRIEAEIANIGSVNFVSGEGQQQVMLTDDRGAPIAYRGFVTLAAGESFVFGTERSWNRASEFQEGFGAVINYAPDISIDGNAANDDCRLQDNRRTISPDEINSLFE